MAISLVLFGINWGLFYGLLPSLKRLNDIKLLSKQDIKRMAIRQAVGALSWVITLNLLSLFSINAGAHAHTHGLICWFWACIHRL